VIVIDQTPIGRTPRSNPRPTRACSITSAICSRKLPAARIRGYEAGRFSFNVKGGRCEKCQGDGLIKIEMHFLPPVYVTCEACNGRRYNRETLEISYKGMNIADVLDMTVDEAVNFFRAVPQIHEPCLTLADVGWAISGGPGGDDPERRRGAAHQTGGGTEPQTTGRTLYILDEPTTGLHFHDVAKLLEVLFKLRASGTRCWSSSTISMSSRPRIGSLTLDRRAARAAGRIVAQGPPEEVARSAGQPYGQYLSRMGQRGDRVRGFLKKYPESEYYAEAVLGEAQARFHLAREKYMNQAEDRQWSYQGRDFAAGRPAKPCGLTRRTSSPTGRPRPGTPAQISPPRPGLMAGWLRTSRPVGPSPGSAVQGGGRLAQLGDTARVIGLLRDPAGAFQQVVKSGPADEWVARGLYLLTETELAGTGLRGGGGRTGGSVAAKTRFGAGVESAVSDVPCQAGGRATGGGFGCQHEFARGGGR
jgi:hypothetical protein